ncbi:integrase core domain-containing protein [Thalassoglobus neptunius]|uniref:integrase core domain-containing protein n=1 Tax=Thalassoglobus neptunius TaxID=1938619 RepID=UPI0011B854AD|nr:integrase core domain-containing protein [Thalassoglobus neptunius]
MIPQASVCRILLFRVLSWSSVSGTRHSAYRIQDWRMTYNHRRPHSSLGGLTPAEFSTQCASVPEKVPPTAPPSPPLQHTDLLT